MLFESSALHLKGLTQEMLHLLWDRSLRICLLELRFPGLGDKVGNQQTFGVCFWTPRTGQPARQAHVQFGCLEKPLNFAQAFGGEAPDLLFSLEPPLASIMTSTGSFEGSSIHYSGSLCN